MLFLFARFAYDSLNRLTREDNKEFNKTFTFSYDAGGNILNKLEYAFTLTNNLDYEDILNNNNYNYCSSGWNDQLLRFNNELFEYDKLGNPTLYRDKTLVWSHGRQLDRFDNIEFKYNTNGIRETKIANGIYTKYYLNGTKVIAQTDTNNNTLYFHYGCDGVISFTLNNVDYVYKKNTQNDIIGIYDINGQEIVKYVYDAWGNHKTYVLNDTSYIDINEKNSYTENGLKNKQVAEINPFRYRSYYYDSETNLYYLNSRYYDPELCRFINADDISILDQGKDFINGLNLYSYCNNNPVMNTDENGESWWGRIFKALAIIVVVVAVAAVTIATAGASSAVGAIIIGATISAGAELFEQAVIKDKSFADVNWAEVGISFVVGGITSMIPGTGFGSIVGRAFVSSWFTNVGKSIVLGEEFSLKRVITQTIIGTGLGLVGKWLGNKITSGIDKLISKGTTNYSTMQAYQRSIGNLFSREQIYEIMARNGSIIRNFSTLAKSILNYHFEILGSLF